MELFFYIFFAIFILSLAFIGIHYFKKDALFVVGIGAIIAANIYTSLSYPIDIFGLTFGMDGVIYTIFIFCILWMYIEYGRKSTKNVTLCAAASTLLTALFSFCGFAFRDGFDAAVNISLPYIFSVIASLFAVMLMIYLYKFLKKKKCNEYVNITISLLCGNVVNSLIYFVVSSLANGIMENVWKVTYGSLIGKTFSVILCVIFVVIFGKFIRKDEVSMVKTVLSDNNEKGGEPSSREQIEQNSEGQEVKQEKTSEKNVKAKKNDENDNLKQNKAK